MSFLRKMLPLPAIFVLACGSTVEPTIPDPEPTPDPDPLPQHTDLFACETTATCETMRMHVSADPHTALICAAELIVSAQPGVLHAVEAPGPNIFETERIIIVKGDGTALVQSRHRDCVDKDPCPSPLPWEPVSTHQICEISLQEGVEAACAAGDETNCKWSPWVPGSIANCMDVEDRTCADVAAILE